MKKLGGFMKRIFGFIFITLLSMLAVVGCKEKVIDTAETTIVESKENILEELNVKYLGGLYARSEVNDMMLALFDSFGTPIVVITEFDKLYYGEYTTESVKFEDGVDYTKITVEGKTYGYHINDDLTGILVDQDGNKYEAKQLDESVAIDMVKRTVNGN